MKLYSCGTYYHTLIAVIKAMKDDEKSDILLANDIPGYDDLNKRLQDSKVFNSIITYDAIRFDAFYVFKSKLDRAFSARKIVLNKIPETVPISSDELRSYSDIYIFNDMTGPAKYLILNKIEYHLLEDALDYFTYFDKYYNIPAGGYTEHGLRKKAKDFFGVGFNLWGQNDFCLDIEVNSIENIKIPTKKVIVLPRKELFNSIDENQKKTIYAIFVKGRSVANGVSGKSMILLTQPLFKDNFVSSMEKQLFVFEAVIKEYSDAGYTVAIKPHPRDEADYMPLISKYNCKYIDKNIPSEMLNFDSTFTYDVAVSITSTAINFLENVNEKRFMGREFIAECVE